jgi:soluble lytic murein transglycosylase-like protein
MQVMPAVARDLAESEGLPQPRWLELLDTRTNIEMGVILLSRLHERYRSWDLALAAYNAGDRAFVEDDDDGVRDDVQAFVRQVSRRARVIRTARAAVPAA